MENDDEKNSLRQDPLDGTLVNGEVEKEEELSKKLWEIGINPADLLKPLDNRPSPNETKKINCIVS